MRKVSREVISAFLAGKPKRNGNTIADKSIAGSIYIYDGGVRSSTTKERLNALLQLMAYESSYIMVASCIFQKNYEWFVRYNNGDKFNFQNGLVLGVPK